MPSIQDILLDCAANGAQQVPVEIAGLLGALIAEFEKSPHPKTILEIGSFSGGTLAAWKQIAAKVVAIDVLHRSAIEGVTYLTGPSSTLVDQAARLACPADFLFIDGDHSYEGVKADFESYLPLVRPGGMIALHDIKDNEHHRSQGCHVARLWDELKTNPRFESFEFLDSALDWGGIGLLRERT